jgi:hypothetical protein
LDVVVGVKSEKKEIARGYPGVQLFFEVFDEGSTWVAVVF